MARAYQTRKDDERDLAILMARDLGMKPRQIAGLLGVGYSTVTGQLRLIDADYAVSERP